MISKRLLNNKFTPDHYTLRNEGFINAQKIDTTKKFRALAKTDYAFYLEYCNRDWKPATHLLLICEKLEKLEKGEIKKLLITIPPRHGKSMSVSEAFPSWFIGRNPNRQVILVSYGDQLAKRFGRRNRNKILEFGLKVFGIKLAKDSASVTDWGINGYRGSMKSAGIGSAVTGTGADCLIIDDPIKNREEAESVIYREKIWDEYESTLRTRLHPNGKTILIQTRWHEDDLAGRILRRELNEWEHINLPCEAEDNDLLGREIGEPLWAEHGFDYDWINGLKNTMSTRVWNSLFQQRPSSQEGNIFKREWFNKFHDNKIDFDVFIQSWDMSFKKTTEGSFVVGQIWGVKGANYYLLYQIRERLGFVDTKSRVKTLKNMYPKTSAILIEDKANGIAIIDELKNDISGIIAIEPKGTKEARAEATTPFWNAGNIYLPNADNNLWIGNFIEEHINFPLGVNDDQVDATSQFINYMRNNKPLDMRRITIGRNRLITVD